MDEAGAGHEFASHESSERWLISYADFITLMFALFVVLYSVSMKKAADRDKSFKSINKAVAGESAAAPQARELAEVEEDLQAVLQHFAHRGLTVTIDSRGLVISLSAVSFFASGDATINQAQLPVLDAVLQVLNPLPNQMRVEGFTDSTPISNQRFADNWDLSAARAGNVLRYMIDHSSVPPEHLSLAGYGPYRPVASNDTEEGRSHNRHVDIVIPPVLKVNSTPRTPEVGP